AHLVLVYGGQRRVAKLKHAIVVTERVLLDVGAKLLAQGVELGQLFFVFRSLLSRVLFLLLVRNRVGFQRRLGLLQLFLARVGSNHDLEDLVFALADFGLGLLDLAQERLVLLVGFDGERLVAILADLLLLVLDFGFVLAAGGVVRLDCGLNTFDSGFGAG